jgi:hypothetical protein
VPERLTKILDRSFLENLGRRLERTFNAFKYGFKVISRNIEGSIYNWYRKPVVSIQQVKEKYGTLRVYFSARDEVEAEIDYEIEKLEVRLARKGAYYKLEEMMEWSTQRGDEPKRYPYKEIVDRGEA